MRISEELIQEADNLAKETGINFKDILEVLCKAFYDNTKEPATKEPMTKELCTT